jgi:hypothetical protein
MDFNDEQEVSTTLFYEIVQDTSTGDIGIQLTCGPMFRAHREVLGLCGGLLPRVREFPKLPIKVPAPELPGKYDPFCPGKKDPYPNPMYHETYIEQNPYTVRQGLLEDLGFSAFSRSEGASILGGVSGNTRDVSELYKVGNSTATELSGQMGTFIRRDPYTLAERYEVDELYEPMFELMRYAYKGFIAYTAMECDSDSARRLKCKNMRDMLYLGARFAVDSLFDDCVDWFKLPCYKECGRGPFLEVFFQLEHYVASVAEPTMYAQLYDALMEMLSSRRQFDAVTQDPRWASLHVDFVEKVLTDNRLAIASEAEVLQLIDYWNASADKPKKLLVRLLGAFRPDMESIAKLSAGPVSGVLQTLLEKAAPPRGGGGKKKALDKEEEVEDQRLFALLENGATKEIGYSFMVRKGLVVMQQHPIKEVGTRRIRVTLSQPNMPLWSKSHEFFCGIAFGSNKYFGFLVRLTDFESIYSFQLWSSASPLPLNPKHLTGAGNKVEFDILLGVEMPRFNNIVPCTLRVLHNSNTVTVAHFEVSADVLNDYGAGLKFMIVGAGFGEYEEIECMLAWVGGGDAQKPTLQLDQPMTNEEIDAMNAAGSILTDSVNS